MTHGVDSLRDFSRGAVSALWYPGGLTEYGLSFYLKLGFFSQNTARVVRSEAPHTESGEVYDRPSALDAYTVNVQGSALQAGLGLHWRLLNGLFSLGTELLFLGAPTTDEGEEVTSPSLHLRFNTAIHF